MSTTETPEALQRQLTATANELIRAHARIRTLEAEVRRLKERLVEKTEKIDRQAEEGS
jgi:flagellar motility protein MotE (MotC chaperone)